MGSKAGRYGQNPYDWTSENPKQLVHRKALLERVKGAVLEGEGVVLLLGARGMGKSTFLADLERELRGESELALIAFSEPPLPSGSQLVAGDMLEDLLGKLLESARGHGRQDAAFEVKLRKQRDLRAIFDAYFAELNDVVDRLVLIYDELDQYAKTPTVGRNFFDSLESARKKMNRQLVVVAAGGLSMLALRTVFGSSMFSRAERGVFEPFQEGELDELAEPLRERAGGLPEDVLPTLRVLSGGNAALATYGLQKLWQVEKPSFVELTQAFDQFSDKHPDFLPSIQNAIFDFSESKAPYHVWHKLLHSNDRITQYELESIRRDMKVEALLQGQDLFDMLRASGLVLMSDSAWREDPILATVVPSILSLSLEQTLSRQQLEPGRQCQSLREQLRADLVEMLHEIYRMAPAFYRSGGKQAKEIMPEAAFAAAIAMGLKSLGWKTSIEATSGAGIADIKASHNRFGEQEAIIEVKIWPRNDYKEIHAQVVSYFVRGVTAMATVMIAAKPPGWRSEYEEYCLTGKVNGQPTHRSLEPPLDEGYFEARWGEHVVEHFLLRLPSRSLGLVRAASARREIRANGLHAGRTGARHARERHAGRVVVAASSQAATSKQAEGEKISGNSHLKRVLTSPRAAGKRRRS